MLTSTPSDNSTDSKAPRFQVALLVLLIAVLCLPVSLMQVRRLGGYPVLFRKVGASEPPPPTIAMVPAHDIYGRWQRKAKLLTSNAQEFQETFSKCFGGRRTLRQLQANLMLKVLRTSTVPLVVVGKDDWLFFTGDLAMDGFRGIQPYSEEKLAQLCGMLESKKRLLQANHIPYLLVLPPDKQTIYPEFVPPQYTQVGPERLALVSSYLRAHPVIDFVDLTPTLVQAKGSRPLYWYTDTHWNYLGGFYGYSAVAERLKHYFPSVHPSKLSDFEEHKFMLPGGDLSIMLGIEYSFESTVSLAPTKQAGLPDHTAIPSQMSMGSAIITRSSIGEIGNAVIFHDSYSKVMATYLARHFRKATWVWGEFDPDLVRHEKPDIVIEERVERRLVSWVQP